MAHDLRHPLGSLTLYLSLLEGPEDPRAGVSREEVVAGMHSACEAMTRLINDLLDFSAMEKGALTLEPRAVEPAAWTRALIPDYDLACRRKGIRLEALVPPSIDPVAMDPRRFRQVLDNLVSNAVKFSNPGSTVCLALAPDGDGARWTVADEGVGIAPDDRARVFQPFVKGSRRPPGGEKSMGLGLALAKRIVDIHGGEIGLDEHRPAGTAVFVRLPGAPPGPAGS